MILWSDTILDAGTLGYNLSTNSLDPSLPTSSLHPQPPPSPLRSLVSPSAAFEESHYKSCSYNRFLTSATGHHATEIRGGILDATSHSIRPLPGGTNFRQWRTDREEPRTWSFRGDSFGDNDDDMYTTIREMLVWFAPGSSRLKVTILGGFNPFCGALRATDADFSRWFLFAFVGKTRTKSGLSRCLRLYIKEETLSTSSNKSTSQS